MEFNEYFPGGEAALIEYFYELEAEVLRDSPGREYANDLLNLLRDKSEATRFHYLHSLRVTVTSTLAAITVFMQPRPAFFSGMVHDAGKTEMPESILNPPPGVWTPKMALQMEQHVRCTHRLLQGKLDYIDQITSRHHRYQKRGYPKRMFPFKTYEELSLAAIPYYAVLLSMADKYDAMHRITSHKPLTGEEIRTEMIRSHPGWERLVKGLYQRDIFITWIEGSKVSIWRPPDIRTMQKEGLFDD